MIVNKIERYGIVPRLLTVIIATSLLLLSIPSSAVSQTRVNYAPLDTVLAKYVQGKLVDYIGLSEDQGALNRFVGYIQKIPRNQISVMSQDERLAFWINAYNALVLQSIMEAFPTVSIKKIEGFYDRMWFVGGRPTTIDNIRMQFLGYEIGDPRAFLATCDGTMGAPPLQPYAFDPDSIQIQLNRVTKTAINDPTFVKMNAEKGEIEVNSYLFWFHEFLDKKYPDKGRFANFPDERASILNFVLDHAEGLLKAELESRTDWKVDLINYIWLLNSNKLPKELMEKKPLKIEPTKKP